MFIMHDCIVFYNYASANGVHNAIYNYIHIMSGQYIDENIN